MGVYLTSGNWADGCTFRVSPCWDSVLPVEDGVKLAAKLFAMPEESFWEAILERVQLDKMSDEMADKTVATYFKKQTYNAYEGE